MSPHQRAVAAPMTMAEAAEYFRVSRRFFQDFLRDRPFYRILGRRKLFFPDDIARIRDALARPSIPSCRKRVKAPATPPAEGTSDSALTELRALLMSAKRKGSKR